MDLFVCIFSQTNDIFDLASTVGLDLFAWRQFVFMLVLMDYQFHLRMTSIHWSSGSKLHAFIYVLRISLGKLHSLEVDSFAVPFSCNNMVTSPITWCCPCARWPISSYHLNRPWKTSWRYGAIAVSCIIVDTVLSIVHQVSHLCISYLFLNRSSPSWKLGSHWHVRHLTSVSFTSVVEGAFLYLTDVHG